MTNFCHPSSSLLLQLMISIRRIVLSLTKDCVTNNEIYKEIFIMYPVPSLVPSTVDIDSVYTLSQSL